MQSQAGRNLYSKPDGRPSVPVFQRQKGSQLLAQHEREHTGRLTDDIWIQITPGRRIGTDETGQIKDPGRQQTHGENDCQPGCYNQVQ